MTREQVKQELRELKSIVILSKNGIEANDTKGLQQKYDKAIAELSYEEQVIFVEHIYNRKPYWKIGLMISYSEEGTRKKWSKTIDKLANMLEIKRTNFDKITENEGALAKFIIDTVRECQFNNCEDCPLYEVDGCSRQEKVIEWLQKECADEV